MSSKKNYVIKIVTDLNKLSNRADEVNPDEKVAGLKPLINTVKDTLKINSQVVALCAPQVGIRKRIFCMKFKDGVIKTIINPMITHSEGLHLSREISASIPGKEYIIPRHDSIIAMYQTENGNIEENKFEGTPCEVFEQMFYMLDGIVISDYGLEIMDGFDEASDEEKEEIITMYMDWLKGFDENLGKEIEANPKMRDFKKAIEFLSSVAKGETEVVPEINGELDFSQSTKVAVEEQNKMEKERIQKIKEKYIDKKEPK